MYIHKHYSKTYTDYVEACTWKKHAREFSSFYGVTLDMVMKTGNNSTA